MYATEADMVNRYGRDELVELTDRSDPPADAIDGTVLATALDAARAEIDAHIGRAYTLPLATVPPILTSIACAIARWRLHTDQEDGKFRTDYEDGVRILQRIAEGKMVLDVPDAADPEPTGGRVRGHASPRVFTRDSLRGF